MIYSSSSIINYRRDSSSAFSCSQLIPASQTMLDESMVLTEEGLVGKLLAKVKLNKTELSHDVMFRVLLQQRMMS